LHLPSPSTSRDFHPATVRFPNINILEFMDLRYVNRDKVSGGTWPKNWQVGDGRDVCPEVRMWEV